MTTAQESFIKSIGQAARQHCKTYQILPSLTIAQAILESNWGKSKLAAECHNYFGMKWSRSASCGYKEYSTKEQKTDGTWYTITAKFRKYGSLTEGIKGYYEFLQYQRYQNLKGVTDYKEACRLIKEDGWATAVTYTESLVTLIEKYRLTQYDGNTKKSVQAAEAKPHYTVGAVYTLQSEMKVRTGAGITFCEKKHTELTVDGKKHDKDKNGALDKGTKVTCKEIKANGNDIWMKTPSGWIAAFYNGRIYIK